MKTRLQKSIEYIKGYCDKHDDCNKNNNKCKMYDSETKTCRLRYGVPADWEYKAEKEVEDEH